MKRRKCSLVNANIASSVVPVLTDLSDAQLNWGERIRWRPATVSAKGVRSTSSGKRGQTLHPVPPQLGFAVESRIAFQPFRISSNIMWHPLRENRLLRREPLLYGALHALRLCNSKTHCGTLSCKSIQGETCLKSSQFHFYL